MRGLNFVHPLVAVHVVVGRAGRRGSAGACRGRQRRAGRHHHATIDSEAASHLG